MIDISDIIKDSNKKIKGVIHIGAFYGEEKKIYNNLEIKNVIWIEANPEYEKIIRSNVGDDLIIISGVGNENTNKSFNVANNGQSSSFLEFETHLIEHPGINFTQKIEVEVKRMETIVEDYKIDMTNFNFLNIDVQGFELEVLKGFGNLLNYVDLVYCEVNEKKLYKDCPLISEIDSFLIEFNFERVHTFMTGHGWGDAIYIKN